MANIHDQLVVVSRHLSRDCRSSGLDCMVIGALMLIWKTRTWRRWTDTEILKLKEMHESRVPSLEELSHIFPRHSIEGIRQMAVVHKLRPKNRDWLKIAHQWRARHMSKEIAR